MESLRGVTRGVGRILGMAEARKKGGGATLGSSTSCTAYVLLPHSMHSYTSVENYAAGLPFVVPSPALLADWHLRHRLIWHKCPGNRPTCAGRAGGPDQPRNQSDLARWLAYAEWYTWPNVIVFESEAGLPAVRYAPISPIP